MLRHIISTFTLLIIAAGCTKTVFVDSRHVVDNKYDSEFPTTPTSEYLEQIMNSVKLVNIMVRYRVYDLPLAARVAADDTDEEQIRELAVSETYVSSPASGTGTIIYNSNNRIALLSCAHIFNFPDTITVMYTDDKGVDLPYIQSVYYKKDQHITVTGLQEMSDFDILARDPEKDIAVIGKRYNDTKMIFNSPLHFPKGKAAELMPGTFVFLMGYPRGMQMVSTAIVGKANKDGNHNFILDAAVHNGISGGPVFAVRDGAPNFEMVGIVYAIAGEMLQFLGPDDAVYYQAYKNNRYSGDIYLRSARQIVYGVTYGLSMESIERFFADNYQNLLRKGYDSRLFLMDKENAAESTN